MTLRYMADGDRSLVRYDTDGDRHATCEVFGQGPEAGWKPMGQTQSVFRGDYEPISESEARTLEQKLSQPKR